MSYFKVVRNKNKNIKNNKNSGKYRARYLLLDTEAEVVKVYSNIIDEDFMFANEKIDDIEFRKRLVKKFNKILYQRQKDYKNKHLIVSFSHLLNDEEIEKAYKIIEDYLLSRFNSIYLVAVHRENRENNDRTAFHIILSKENFMKMIDFNRVEFFEIKKELNKFFDKANLLNETEKKAFKNLLDNKTTKSNKNRKQDIKNKMIDIAESIMNAIKNDDFEEAKKLIDKYNFNVEYKKAKKRERLYIIADIEVDNEKRVEIRIRADRHIKSFYQNYFELLRTLVEVDNVKKFAKREKDKKRVDEVDIGLSEIKTFNQSFKEIEKTREIEKTNKEYRNEYRKRLYELNRELQKSIERIRKFTARNRTIENREREANNFELKITREYTAKFKSFEINENEFDAKLSSVRRKYKEDREYAKRKLKELESLKLELERQRQRKEEEKKRKQLIVSKLHKIIDSHNVVELFVNDFVEKREYSIYKAKELINNVENINDLKEVVKQLKNDNNVLSNFVNYFVEKVKKEFDIDVDVEEKTEEKEENIEIKINLNNDYKRFMDR